MKPKFTHKTSSQQAQSADAFFKGVGETVREQVSLTPNEKIHLHAQISMELYGNQTSFQYSPYFGYAWLRRIRVAAVMLIALPIMTVAAAEQSLPGDMLYGIKTNVNEEVVRAASLSPAAKARWETARVSRRVSEINQLLRADEVDEQAVSLATARLDKHVAQVQSDIQATIADNDPETADAVSLALSAQLGAQENVLEQVARKETDEKKKEQTTTLAKQIETTANAAAEDRTEVVRQVEEQEQALPATYRTATLSRRITATEEKLVKVKANTKVLIATQSAGDTVSLEVDEDIDETRPVEVLDTSTSPSLLSSGSTLVDESTNDDKDTAVLDEGVSEVEPVEKSYTVKIDEIEADITELKRLFAEGSIDVAKVLLRQIEERIAEIMARQKAEIEFLDKLQ